MFAKQPFIPFNQTSSTQNSGGQTETYTIIWSNVPKHMRYQIGTLRTGYNLILEETVTIGTPSVDLVLYDGGGSIIWCALSCNSPVSAGFRFPDNFLIPTDFQTYLNEQDTGCIDQTPHNTLDPTIHRHHI
jgi:hypothetical protein